METHPVYHLLRDINVWRRKNFLFQLRNDSFIIYFFHPFPLVSQTIHEVHHGVLPNCKQWRSVQHLSARVHIQIASLSLERTRREDLRRCPVPWEIFHRYGSCPVSSSQSMATQTPAALSWWLLPGTVRLLSCCKAGSASTVVMVRNLRNLRNLQERGAFLAKSLSHTRWFPSRLKIPFEAKPLPVTHKVPIPIAFTKLLVLIRFPTTHRFQPRTIPPQPAGVRPNARSPLPSLRFLQSRSLELCVVSKSL